MCPDITMCMGKKCPLKKTCHRYMAKNNKYQSYFVKEPNKGDKCEYYWKIK